MVARTRDRASSFYYSYELIRRFAHLGKVQPRAFRNQLYLIDLERFLHIYTESAVQKAFLGARGSSR